MIIKSLSIKTKPGVRALINYLVKVPDRLVNESGESVLVLNNLRSENEKGWSTEMMANEEHRIHARSNSIYAHHEILSFHKDDGVHITNEMLRDFATKYIELRAPNAQVVSVAHFDKDHHHLHFAISGVNYKVGSSSSISKSRFAEIKKEVQEMQQSKYPELIHSVVNHEKRQDFAKESLLDRVEERRLTNKEIISFTLQEAFKKSNSERQLISNLKEEGIEAYHRNEKLTGVWFEGRKYRFRTLGFYEELTGLQEPWGKQNNDEHETGKEKNNSKDIDRDGGETTKDNEVELVTKEDRNQLEKADDQRESNESEYINQRLQEMEELRNAGSDQSRTLDDEITN